MCAVRFCIPFEHHPLDVDAVGGVRPDEIYIIFEAQFSHEDLHRSSDDLHLVVPHLVTVCMEGPQHIRIAARVQPPCQIRPVFLRHHGNR